MLHQLPIYQCHKRVRAARIIEAMHGEDGQAGKLLLETASGQLLEQPVPADWMAKHEPEIGGFYVLYEDGYASYSPAQAFEEGYHLALQPRELTAEELADTEHLAGQQWGSDALAHLASMAPTPLRFNQVSTIAGVRYPTDWKGQKDE